MFYDLHFCECGDCFGELEAVEETDCESDQGDIYQTWEVTWYCPCCDETETEVLC